MHRLATQFGLKSETAKQVCPCCQLPLNTRRLSFCQANLANIGEVSLRSKEYFQVIIFFFLVQLILFVCSSVPQFVFVPQISKCLLSYCENEVESLGKYFEKLTTESELKYQVPDLLLCCSVLLIFLLKNLFFWFLVRQDREHNKKTGSVKHFSVHAHNLKGQTDLEIRDEVVGHFQRNAQNFKFLTDGKGLEISRDSFREISLIKDVSSIHGLVFRFIKEIKSYKIKKQKGQMTRAKETGIKKKMKGIRRRIIKVREAKYLHEAIITFNDAAHANQLLTGKWKTAFKKYMTKDLFFSRVLSPRDVIWENFGDSDWRRLFKSLLSFLISALIVFGRSQKETPSSSS